MPDGRTEDGDMVKQVPRLTVGCPLCGHAGRPERTVRDHLSPEEFDVHVCPECDLAFLADPPRPDMLGSFYENEAGESMHAGSGRLFDAMRRVGIGRDLRPLLGRLAVGAKVLDYGAGDGGVARHCAERGFQVEAVDVYPAGEWPHRGIAYRQQAIGATEAAGATLLSDGSAPDAVVLRHVLEHVYQPRALLEQFRRQGTRYVFAIVPNRGSRMARRLGDNWFYWDPPRHLTFFNPTSVGALAGRSGWKVALLQTTGLDEVVTGAHRALLLSDALGSRPDVRRRLVDATRPKGLLAGLSSAASAPFGAAVCKVLFEAAS